MHILFITASRIGDAILSTGLLDHIARTHPNAKVTIVCGPLCVSLFEGYPLLERVIPLKKQAYNKHWIDLWRQVAGTRWERVIDLRNSAVSRVVPARQRFIYGRHINAQLHKAEQNAAVMKLPYTPDPAVWLTAKQIETASSIISPGSKILAVAPTANWLAKTWPAERFIEVIGWLTAPGGLMPQARVAVFAAPGEESGARRVLAAVPPDRQIDVIAKTDPGTAAACLARCDFFIGNDSGLMHAAAAAGIPTLGLFGPSYPHLYRPWGKKAAYVATPEKFNELINYPGYTPQTAPCLMESLTVEAVKSACEKILQR
jgi:heptosyltransferase-3